MDYKKISQDVVDHVGGISNIKGATHCVTRLRLILNDETKYDRKALENIEGVKGVLFNSGQLMIIFGTGTVNNVYDAFIELTGVKEMSQSDAKAEGMSKMGKLQQGFKVFSDIFIPIIPAFVAAAILTGVKALLTANGLFGLEGSLADQSKLVADIAEFLAIMATTFNYLPILVMYSAVKRFGGNPILGILVGIVMVHPDLVNRNTFVLDPSAASYWHFGPLAIAKVAFQGGVFPAILTAWFMSKVEKIAQKYVPAVVSFVFVPTITIFFANVALFTVFGPVGNMIGNGLAAVIDVLYNSFGAFGAFVFAALLQPLVVTGTHQAIQGIEANLIATTGFNYIQGIWSVSIIAQGGGAIGMYLLAKKHSKDRDIAMSSFIPTLVGISEPAIFAANLKYSVIPFVCSCLGAGCGGAFMKLAGVRAIGQGLTGILGLLIVVPNKLVFYVIGNLIAFIVPIVLIVIYNKTKGVPHGEEEEEAESALTIDETAKVPVKAVVVRTPMACFEASITVQISPSAGAKTVSFVGMIPTPSPNTFSEKIPSFTSSIAITFPSTNNSVFLIHVGIETVSMNGEGFEYLVKKGQHVKEGQPILKFDKAKIEAKGLNPVVVFVKTDEGNQTPVAFKTGINVKAGKDVIGE